MMTATILRLPAALPRRSVMLRRAVAAGTAWGLFMGSALTAWTTMQCGVFCFEAAVTDMLGGVTVGVFTIGPLGAVARPH